METTLRRIGETVGALIDAMSSAWADGAWLPEGWPPMLWILLGALFVLLAMLAFRRRQPRPLEVRPPQLLITQGEIAPDTPADGAPRRRRRGTDPSGSPAGSLTMTVSNLSRYPVQLLEVALREESRGAPRVAEVEAVVPAMGSVDVAVRVPLSLRGDGWIDLYCYAAAPRHKVHRHRAELVWEPWAARFKVAPMEQVARPVKRLASEDRLARFEPEDPSSAGEVAAAAAPPPAPAAPHASERAGARGQGVDRPTAVPRVAVVPNPTPDSDDALAPATPADTPSLGALWDRLPQAARVPIAEDDGSGSLVPLGPRASTPPGAGPKPARVASSSISPATPPDPLDGASPTGRDGVAPARPTPLLPLAVETGGGPTPRLRQAAAAHEQVGAAKSAAPETRGDGAPATSSNRPAPPPPERRSVPRAAPSPEAPSPEAPSPEAPRPELPLPESPPPDVATREESASSPGAARPAPRRRPRLEFPDDF